MLHKKQMYNLLTDIYAINKRWGNQRYSYDDQLESSMLVEEALEPFDPHARETSRQLIESYEINPESITDVERFDKHLDAIYISIGSIFKLGVTTEQLVDGLQAVHNANLTKIGSKDANGKVVKPENFTGPEPYLQQLLDRRPQ